MDLKEWLYSDSNTMSIADFARAVGVQRSVVYWWCEGKHLPAQQHWHTIQRTTRDSVRAPEDFLPKYREYQQSKKKALARSSKKK